MFFKTYRRIGAILLSFEWHGGPYIDVASTGEAAQEVINVWDYEADAPCIARTLEAFECQVSDWIDDYGYDNLLRDVTQNWSV